MQNRLFLLVVLFVVFVGHAQESFSLTSESTLKINGSSTIHDWTVEANSIKGNMEVKGEEIKELLFQVDVAKINSERGAAMDKKMHAALKKEEHPQVSFKLKEVKEVPEAVNTLHLKGLLTIAGVGKVVEITSQFQKEDGNYTFKGAKEITLQEFDMVPPTAMFGQIIVGDDVTVDFDLVFAKN
ncbi:MAG: YceI family protein [Arenibacter sp.]|nr:YceI family protein [Arenibacter sp.]